MVNTEDEGGRTSVCDNHVTGSATAKPFAELARRPKQQRLVDLTLP